MIEFIVTDISQLVTNAPLAQNKKIKKIQVSDLGILENAWLAIKEGFIHKFGCGELPAEFKSCPKMSAEDCLVTPGLVDSHTHAIFAGSRASEFAMKLEGKTYQEIASCGGGILSSVTATRAASAEILLENLQDNLKKFLEWGVTTVEVKTGYGLSVAEELRLLTIIQKCKENSKQNIYVTCLALHGLMPAYKSHAEYAEQCRFELLPQLKKRSLADAVDAFIDHGYFSVKDCDGYFNDAKNLGLDIRVHADEFSDAKASIAGINWGAKSIDHTQFINAEAIQQLSKSNTVAILLPGTSLYSRIPFANARILIDQNCAVAVASDFNPGSCKISNLPMVATISAIQCGMNMAEVFAAVTYVPAFSLGLEQKIGHLDISAKANFVIHQCKNLEEWVADCGQSRPKYVHV